MNFKILLTSILIRASCGVGGNSINSFIDLGYAKYAGVFDSTTRVTKFLGIRYAAPPTGSVVYQMSVWLGWQSLSGDLRWRAPQPPKVIHDVQPADTQPPGCKAISMTVQNAVQDGSSEDCLFLKYVSVYLCFNYFELLFYSVYVPEPYTNKLPVLVWIHGYRSRHSNYSDCFSNACHH